MDATRSTRLIAVGAAALVVGAALAALAVRGATSATAAPADTTPVAAAPTEAAAPVTPAPRIPETVAVPEGFEAVALQLPFDASVAGLPSAGDRVHVYAVVGTRDGTETEPTVERVLDAAEVLAITGPDVEAGGGTPTVVLAVAPADVDDVVLAQTSERVWLTLTPPTTPEA